VDEPFPLSRVEGGLRQQALGGGSVGGEGKVLGSHGGCSAGRQEAQRSCGSNGAGRS